MKGDFSRDTFDLSKRYVRVLMQQGRVQLDADQREENSILLHYLQNLAKDLIGAHGGPSEDCGFEIICQEDSGLNFIVGNGHYYVDGILCELDSKEPLAFDKQPDYPLSDSERLNQKMGSSKLVYLDVWERHITCIEDGSIREVALGGSDTATRSKIIFQVKTFPIVRDVDSWANKNGDITKLKLWASLLEKVQPLNRGRIKARAKRLEPIGKAALNLLQVSGGYCGAENRLYRVEIHSGGRENNVDGATYKWSRENGSVAFPIEKLEGNIVTLGNFGSGKKLGLSPGDLVEIEDDEYVLQNRSEKLCVIKDVVGLQLVLEQAPESSTGKDPKKHPLLRRWDHKKAEPKIEKAKLRNGALIIKENEWQNIENDIQIFFTKDDNTYRRGDYWLIPARVANQDVEWPGAPMNPQALQPHGVEHHYAPLAVLKINEQKNSFELVRDCRRKFKIQTI
jgi:hypothetical protein